MATIDLNADLGEGSPLDGEVMPFLSSANVGCGFHAGDWKTSLEALLLARRHGVRVGSHPGFPDRENFGRLEQTLSEPEVFHLVYQQTGALLGLATFADWPITYIKPHGALYHQAARQDSFARPIVRLAEAFGLAVLGLPGSKLEYQCEDRVPFVREGFADRRYRSDGTLVPRQEPNAMIHEVAEAVEQAKHLIASHGIQSLCVHGDNPAALEFVKALRSEFATEGIEVQAFT